MIIFGFLLRKGHSMGIIICGLNGTGKSTLGKALAEKLHFHFIDIENLYFPKTNPNYIYASPRTRKEVEKLLLHEIKTHKNFILASVKGDYGEVIYSLIQYAILLDVPKNIRLQRVKKRSFQKFGKRMLSGGDLFEQEEKFFRFVESRNESTVEEWVKTLKCPVMRIDGTKPIDENTDFIIALMRDKYLFAKEMGNKK
ncbi:AAA family ATPase [Roseburia sp. 1XD42-69]|uniref:AAA family ATPase n=1 Tax=Roseburia sp. 1XD42-69 TaxID=2320088 RepID=UPI001FA9F498|nr:AAA family ATPase [Roseburia sp. 1XD42-69]